MADTLIEALKPGHCHKCGQPFVKNPHPDAGKPDRYLEVGCQFECLPCTVLSRHQWAGRAMKAEGELRELKAAIASNAAVPAEQSDIRGIAMMVAEAAYKEGCGRDRAVASDKLRFLVDEVLEKIGVSMAAPQAQYKIPEGWKLVPDRETPEWRAGLTERGYSHKSIFRDVLASAPVYKPAPVAQTSAVDPAELQGKEGV